MKNLKKLTRKDLKSLKGGGIGDGCFAHIVPGDELPAPGDAYDCGCNRLMWCPAMAACIFTSQYTPERCEGIS